MSGTGGTIEATDSADATAGYIDGLAYDAWGPASGIPVIQLHGLTSSRARDVVLHLDLTAGQDHLRVLRYDARGHGHSLGARIPALYHWSSLARDMGRMMHFFDETGVDGVEYTPPVAAVGQSMGAATILTAAAADPATARERFSCLVLGIPPTAWELRGNRAAIYEADAQFVEEHGLAAFAETTRAEPVPPTRGADVPFTWPDIDQSLLPSVYRGAAGNDLPPRQRIAELGKTDIPVFILGWVEDKGHPLEVLHELSELIPSAQTTIAHTPEDVATWPDQIGEFIRDNA
ncbi:alpha/beta hydrolase [Corynebacterium terpenotabidum]|uniref:Putative hydrolase n=1 Tax=Corynebacterium terpenotabidum Y-11 TaxID=1200352 RepID=S4XJ80_9CORY|nr:alpha/beta hydrolase [Corynebacterium terpenotabidum]AGP31810.1 putative hydrolase [Corynebacterium terpenotabidum Y-11]